MSQPNKLDWMETPSLSAFVLNKILFKLKYNGLDITFKNALMFANEQDEIYPARLAAMVISRSRE